VWKKLDNSDLIDKITLTETTNMYYLCTCSCPAGRILPTSILNDHFSFNYSLFLQKTIGQVCRVALSYWRWTKFYYFLGELLRLKFTLMWAYNYSVKLQKVLLYDDSITYDGTWGKFKIHPSIPW